MAVTPARVCAYRVIRRVFEDGAFADRALHAEARGLEPRERALATALAYGVVQRRRTLDHVLAPLVRRGLDQVEAPVLASLRLGAHQLVLMDGISEYAAVNESVELIKRERPGAGGFVNAVLRRVAREGAARVTALDDTTPERAAVLHSVPDWLARLWWDELGAEDARLLLATVNRPAESSLRVNTLRASREAVSATLGELGVIIRPAPEWRDQPGLPAPDEGLIVEGAFDVFGSTLWEAGTVMPQSRGSMAVARALAPPVGARVLDLCAAPGGKTTQIAALMSGGGEVVAVEVHPGRAEALRRTCERLGADSVEVVNADARRLERGKSGTGWRGPFDRVLVDPPCSGLGTLQIRPDLRWQPRRGQLGDLATKQLELLSAGAAHVGSRGELIYSVCTISQTESTAIIERFTAANSEFALESAWTLLPHREGTDGFFIARLCRTG